MRINDNEITYRNDYVFKTTLKGDDEDSKYVLKFLIEAVTKREYKEVEVINSELLGEYINSKNSYLDIKAVDIEGNIINIEMQQSYINALQRQRIQYYGCRSVTIQPIKGERYDKLNKVEQIVFSSKRYNGKLYTQFSLREKNGNELKDNLVTYHIISLPYIEEVFLEKENKKIPLDDLEVLSYAYHFMIDNGILNVADDRQKKVLDIMMKKREYILEDETTYDIAKAIAYAEASQDADLETAHEIGILEGYENGKIIGFKSGHEEGFKSGHEAGFKSGQEAGFKSGQEVGFKSGQEVGFKSGQEVGFKSGQEEGFNAGVIEMLNNFIRVKFNEKVNLTNISLERLENIKEKIYTIETSEQLKQLIEEN